jgi:hypothetical protein
MGQKPPRAAWWIAGGVVAAGLLTVVIALVVKGGKGKDNRAAKKLAAFDPKSAYDRIVQPDDAYAER